MPRTATQREVTAATRSRPLALAVADANWFTTEHLFTEVHRAEVSTLLLSCLDYRNALRRGQVPRPWSRRTRQRRPGLWHRELVLPSGWMKTFPAWGMRPIRHAVESWRDRHAADGPLTLVMTYPHYLFLRDQLRPDCQVYFNIDDYSQYWPHRAATIHSLELQAVREADLTVCVSALRCAELQAAAPSAAGRIRHLPHGAASSVIAPRPWCRPAPPPPDLARLPGPRLGYVGTLEDRVDWPLLDQLAGAFPAASLVLVGRRGRGRAWPAEARRCLARPNVHAIGWRPQRDLAALVAAFDVCLIPYRTDHPFNRVCCPTKIMDYMGSGRPIVSTDLPECRLHGTRFDVAGSPEEFLAAVGRILAAGADDGRAELRHAFAVENSCARTVERLLDWLPG